MPHRLVKLSSTPRSVERGADAHRPLPRTPADENHLWEFNSQRVVDRGGGEPLHKRLGDLYGVRVASILVRNIITEAAY